MNLDELRTMNEIVLMDKINEAVQAWRTTNFLLLAQALGLDATNPLDQVRLRRHMESVERGVGGNDG